MSASRDAKTNQPDPTSKLLPASAKMTHTLFTTALFTTAAMAMVVCLLSTSAMAASAFLAMSLLGIWRHRAGRDFVMAGLASINDLKALPGFLNDRYNMQLPGADAAAHHIHSWIRAAFGAPQAVAVAVATPRTTAPVPEENLQSWARNLFATA